MPDMRLPIGLALGAPDRLDEAYGPLDWTTLGTLTFEPPDLGTFRALRLAYDAGRTGGTAPAVLNGANEVAVAAFLDRRVPWSAIAEVVEETLQGGTGNADTLADVLEADRVARTRAGAVVERRTAA
jgi:1-deoxy-D-xylulose-5-phosphate reductoisomerase